MIREDARVILKLLSTAKISKTVILLIVILGVISSLFAILPAQFIGIVIDTVAADNGSANIGSIGNALLVLLQNASDMVSWSLPVTALAAFLILSIASSVIRNIYCCIASITSNKIIRDIRELVVENILNREMEYFENESRANIVYNIMTDTSNMQLIYSQTLYTFGSDILDLLWISIFIIVIDPVIYLILLAVTPLIYCSSLYAARCQKRITREVIDEETKMSVYVDQLVSGIDIVKAYSGENREKTLFGTCNSRAMKKSNESDLNLSLYFPIEKTLRVTGTVLALLYSIAQIANGSMTAGVLPIIFLYSQRFYAPISNFTKYYQMIQRGVNSTRRVGSILAESGNSHKQEYVRGSKRTTLRLDGVSLSVDGKELLRNLNQNLTLGDLVLIKGKSGTGKTTLLKLILGYKYPDRGSVLVNDINSYQIKNISHYISYANQSSFVHDLTLLDNVLYPKSISEVSEERRENAVKLLFELGFSEEQIARKAGEAGKLLSGGEKQRVSLARAVNSCAPIMLLDEITSNIDNHSAQKIISIIKEIKDKRIIILVTHSSNRQLEELATVKLDIEDKSEYEDCFR
ncbi:hypothetical protein CSA37_07870 [Candidatus Fermentibacteria bacterium]|nr:MAG: hypothetical protein CSA37_07870 [Candidatus Fermentibacteria bacterium]